MTGTNGVTLNIIFLCHLYAFLKQWVNEENVDSDSTVKPDIGFNSDNETAFIFSSADCKTYRYLTGFGHCTNITDVSDVYSYNIGELEIVHFIHCSIIFLMNEMGATEKSLNPSLVYDNDAEDGNFFFLDEDEIGMTILSVTPL